MIRVLSQGEDQVAHQRGDEQEQQEHGRSAFLPVDHLRHHPGRARRRRRCRPATAHPAPHLRHPACASIETSARYFRASTAEQAAVIETGLEQQIGRTHKRLPTPEPPRSTRPTSNVARAGASPQSPPQKAPSPTPAKRSRRTTKVRGDPRTCCTRSPTSTSPIAPLR